MIFQPGEISSALASYREEYEYYREREDNKSARQALKAMTGICYLLDATNGISVDVLAANAQITFEYMMVRLAEAEGRVALHLKLKAKEEQRAGIG